MPCPSDNGPADKGDDVRITFDQYQQIEIGMTYDEVKNIVGGDGSALSETADMVVYSYYGAGGYRGECYTLCSIKESYYPKHKQGST